jgi:HlyD family secretion protein/adhesin transport system membrane fusion protein
MNTKQIPPTLDAPSAKPEKRRRQQRQVRFLANAVQLEEQGPPLVLTLTPFVILGLLAILVGWASIARIPISISSEGEVRTVEPVHPVQHLEGGIVSEVLVKDGDRVEAGQVMVRLAPATRDSDLAELATRRSALSLRVERLRALVEGRAPDFDGYGEDYVDLIADQLTIFVDTRRALADEHAVLASRIGQNQAEASALEHQLAALRVEGEVLGKERLMQQALFEKRLISRLDFLRAEREYQRVVGQVSEVAANRQRAEIAIQEAKNRMVEAQSQRREQWNRDLGLLVEEIAQLDQAITKFEDRVARLELRAPVGGTVNGLLFKTPGSVIAPGAEVVGIVPGDGALRVTARIPPEDIGQVVTGQSVDVRISTYDVGRFGSVDGTVTRISADRFLDEREGTSYYEADIRLASNHVEEALGSGVEVYLLKPGMTVSASVLTGERTFLEYLLKPIYQSLSTAFSEQ